MKKFLLSLILLCTTMSAWSQTTYTEDTVTINFFQANPVGLVNCDNAFMAGGQIDETTKRWKNGLRIMYANKGCVITSVEFVMSSGSIDQCESTNGNWKFDSTSDKWVQDGTFAYDEIIAFSSTSSCLIERVTITYHKHTFAHNEGVAASCVAQGRTENWYCNDCGRSYYDEKGANEVAKSEDLILPIDPTNHNGKLKEVAHKNASVIEEGTLHHWHCEACGKDYADADAQTDITGKTVKAKYDADAILIGMNEGKIIDDSFMLLPSTEETVTVATVTFEEDDTIILDIAGKGGEKTAYSINETNPLETSFAHTFKLKANQDPDHTDRYYSTFFTSEGAYKVPSEAKAYAGEVKTGEETDVLKLTSVGNIIHQSEPVILKASTSDITLMPSCNKVAASTENVLEGTDEGKTLGANQYALSLGQNGVGFYLWNGKPIGANKAYLILTASAGAKAFTFDFDDGTATGITLYDNDNDNGNMYNLNGIRVGKNYKGIVIKNGKKYIAK